MRPERLELEGFTVFRDRTEVDFTDAELFAFTGPTGAGKSSLIDAVIFALYGTVPRLADRRRVAPVVSQGRVEARVGLDFVAGGRRFSAVRVVRLTATGAASTKEARLEETHPDGSREVLAGDADELTEAVTELLGLTYEHFTTAVVLPQGEFTRLLHAKPTERQALLKELLDLGIYDRLQQRAGTEQRNLGVRKEVLAHRLEGFADATPERRDALQHRIDVLRTLLAQLDEDAQQLRRLETDRHEAEADAGRLAATASSLEAIHPPDGLEELDRDVADATAAVEAAGSALEVADAAVERSTAALAAVPPSEETTALLERYAELDRQRSQLERGQRALEAAREHAADRRRHRRHRRRRPGTRETALAAAQLAHRAAALAASLQPGDDCPVCGNRFDGLPHDAPTELAEATASPRCGPPHGRRRHPGGAARTTRSWSGSRRSCTGSWPRWRRSSRPSPVLGPWPPPATISPPPRSSPPHGNRPSATCVTGGARCPPPRSCRPRRPGVVSRRGPRSTPPGTPSPPSAIPLTRDNLAADWATLTGWAATRAADATAVAAKATDQAASHQRAADLVQRRMLAAAQQAGIIATDPADPAELPRATLRAQEADKAALARLEDDLKEASRLRAELAAATDDEQVASLLARLLRSDRFGAWVLDDALQRLVTGATDLLHRLSSGAYSLVLDGKDFAVIDHPNADARALGSDAVGRRDVPRLPGPGPRPGRSGGAAGRPTAAPPRIDVPRRGLRHPRPRHARHRGDRHRGARQPGPAWSAWSRHVRDLAERLPGALRGAQGSAGATRRCERVAHADDGGSSQRGTVVAGVRRADGLRRTARSTPTALADGGPRRRGPRRPVGSRWTCPPPATRHRRLRSTGSAGSTPAGVDRRRRDASSRSGRLRCGGGGPVRRPGRDRRARRQPRCSCDVPLDPVVTRHGTWRYHPPAAAATARTPGSCPSCCSR